jgi:hypothetical protein
MASRYRVAVEEGEPPISLVESVPADVARARAEGTFGHGLIILVNECSATTRVRIPNGIRRFVFAGARGRHASGPVGPSPVDDRGSRYEVLTGFDPVLKRSTASTSPPRDRLCQCVSILSPSTSRPLIISMKCFSSFEWSSTKTESQTRHQIEFQSHPIQQRSASRFPESIQRASGAVPEPRPDHKRRTVPPRSQRRPTNKRGDSYCRGVPALDAAGQQHTLQPGTQREERQPTRMLGARTPGL